ncbi:MAG: FG-GAP-like repeat-containing protein, partial [Pyrinomonadaceae bacterium]
MLLLLILVSLLQMNSATFSLQQRRAQNRQKQARAATRRPASREEAYRANNLGVALLEQFKYREGAEEFKRALQLDPKLKLARTNLSIALYNVPDLEGALREARAAAALDTNAPQPHYIMGLVARSQSRTEDAIKEFRRVLEADSQDTGANVNVGQLLAQQRNYAEAIKSFRTALDAEPYNLTALYNLAITLTRNGERAEGQRLLQKFQELRANGAGTTTGTNYLEQGRYAEAIASIGAESELVNRATPLVVFTDATTSMLPDDSREQTSLTPNMRRGGHVTLFDWDGDGDLDLLVINDKEQRLYRNDKGKFVDVTKSAGALTDKIKDRALFAVAGDYDNDGRPDLFVMLAGGASLYHNDGNGSFSDVTKAANIPAYPYLSNSAAFVDVDHDGDLDIFIAGQSTLATPLGNAEFPSSPGVAGAPNMLLRNDGNGKFTDVTDAAKVKGELHPAVAVVPTDFNNRRDVDLLVVNYGAPPDLFSNQRDGTFRNVAKEVGLDVSGRWTCVAAGDVNKDGFTDFFFGGVDAQAGLFAMSDGKGHFKTFAAPKETEGASAAQFIDYDNDGLLDCVIFSNDGLRVLRNLGDSWSNVSKHAVSPLLFSNQAQHLNLAGRILAAGDLDGDGDTDLITCALPEPLKIVRNDGGNRNRSIRVNLQGRVSNRSGVEAKIEVRAGSLVQKLETYAASPAPAPADIIFGLGKRVAPDAVRVLWPSGVVQSEIEMTNNQAVSARTNGPAALTLPVIELDRKPSSCPYLYTWNGERFEFITDFMGGGEMGYLEEPGRRNTPDPDEYVRIRSEQLKERDGRYELRVTNELEETLYADKFQLIAIAHPRGVEVYPNEGMIDPPLPPFKLYATRDAHAPLGATDDHGHDVLARVSKLDRTYPDDFKLQKIRGYSDEHTLTLKLDEDGATRKRTLLLLTGWTDYAWSSDNVAASQSGKSMKLPALQVKNGAGEW